MLFVPIPLFVPTVSVGGVTLDPANKGTIVSLSGGNLTATTSTHSYGLARSTTSHITGKWAFEGVVNAGVGATNAMGIGVGMTGADLNNFLGSDANAEGFFQSGDIFFSGSGQATYFSFSNGDRIGVYLDATGSQYWVTKDGLTYNAGGTANPATGIGGQGIGGFAGNPLFAYVCVNGTNATASWTAAFSGLTYGLPVGYSNW